MSYIKHKKNMEILSGETGSFTFPPGSRDTFALLYPNSYKAGMSNLGFHIIYREVNKRGDTACERFFLPNQHETPVSVESGRRLDSFPVIGVMMSFEPDYFNLLNMLDMGKVPLLAQQREEKHPLVVIGGPCATFNPEPLALFADAFVIGEGEDVVNNMLDVLYANKGLTRKEKLRAIAQMPGLYVPVFYQPVYDAGGKLQGMQVSSDVPEKITRQWIKEIDDFAGNYQIITPNTEFSSMFAIEVARGCGRHCRFCMAGYCFRPPRSRNFEKLWQAILDRPPESKKVGLLGAAVCDHPDIKKLVAKLSDNNIAFSLSSLRADMLDKTFIEALAKSNLRTLTIAPEAGSERLRKVINKGIEEKDILNAIDLAIQNGIRNIRLYFMLGLPTETETDIFELEQLVLLSKEKLRGKKSHITLSINPFVPKPFTPFQWDSIIDEKTFKQRIDYLRKAFKSDKNIEIKVESYKSSLVQFALSCGDRNTGRLLLETYKSDGLKTLARMLKKEVKLPKYDVDDYLPWEHLDMGFAKDYLLKEREKAFDEKTTYMCFEGCRRCGIGRLD